MKRIIAMTSVALMVSALCLSSCKNGKGETGNGNDNANQTENTQTAQPEQEVQDERIVDVEYLANLYCKNSDEEMAKVFIGEIKDDFFVVNKDKENNFAQVYTRSQYDSNLQFYVWTAEDDTKILGVNIIEVSEDSRRVLLQFFSYNPATDSLVPYEELDTIFSDAISKLGTSLYMFRIPESPENEDMVLGSWDADENYSEKVFKWDGRTFKEI